MHGRACTYRLTQALVQHCEVGDLMSSGDLSEDMVKHLQYGIGASGLVLLIM